MSQKMMIAHGEYVLGFSETILSKTDSKGNFTYVNQDCLRISGYTQEELLGQHQSLMRHPDMPKAISEDFWKTLNAGKTWVGIMKNRAKNGDFYWVETNAAPILENSQVVGYISIRVKPTQAQITAADEAYQALNKGLSHIEIRQGKAVARARFKRLHIFKTWSLQRKIIAMGIGLAVLALLSAALSWQGIRSGGTALRAIAFEISTAEFCISATGLKANADILSLKSCSASMKN